MGSSFFTNPTDYTVVEETGEGPGFYDGPAYTAIDPVAIADSVAEAAASAAASSASATSAASSAATAASVVQAAAGTATPLVDGTAAVGAGVKWAREDHVHPTDTSRADAAATTAALALKAATTYVDAQDAALTAAVALKAATTYVDAADATLTAAIALKAPLASPALTGNPTAPTQTAGDNSTKIATTAYVDDAVGGAGVSSLNGQTGALSLIVPPLGRLTLASGVPVMATSQAGKTTVYYTPYCGNIVPVYDGTNMVPTVFSELSQATTDATKSPAAVAASKLYDMFVWNDGGTVRCTRGPAWTNSSTRGYTLTMVNGILLNTSAITNGPAASRGTWVGTIASNASSTIDFIFGGAASGGLAGVFNVWNAYHRVNVGCTVVDQGAAYTLTSSTWRQARASAGMQVSFVVGASDEAVSAIYQNVNQMVAAAGVARIGIGYDSITSPSNNNAIQGVAAGTLIISPNVPFTVNAPAPGAHYFAAMENSDGTNANTFNLGGAVSTSGFSVSIRM